MEEETKKIIPYHPSQIKIEKQSGKKTPSLFCAPRGAAVRRQPTSPTEDASVAIKVRSPPPLPNPSNGVLPRSRKPNGNSVSVSERGSTITMSSMAEDSDFSDNLSVVSDISDLSVMSLNHSSFTSTMSFNQAGGGNSSKTPIVPGVHGVGVQSLHGSASLEVLKSKRNLLSNPNEQRQVRRLTKKIAFLQSEKEVFERQFTISSSQRSEIYQMKEENFQLRRENVNLKGQVESLQNLQRSMVVNSGDPSSKHTQEATKEHVLQTQQLQNNEVISTQEFRLQIRKAHDEIFRLQSEDAKTKLELRSKTNEIEVYKQKIIKFSEDNSGLKDAKKMMESKISGLESTLMHLRSSTSEEGNQNALIKSDLESAIKSRDWYAEQLQTAQNQRTDAQEEIVAIQKEISAKNMKIEELTGQVEEVKTVLTNEKLKYQKEKEDFTSKLKKIESEMSDQEAQLDAIQTEKDAMISDLSDRLGRTDCNAQTIQELSENILSMEGDLKMMKIALEAKDGELEKAKNKSKSLDEASKELSEKLATATGELQASKTEGKEMELTISKLESNLSTRNELIEGFQRSIKEKDEIAITLKGEKENAEQNMELLLMEIDDKKRGFEETSSKKRELEKRVEQLETELLEQHQLLDDLHAQNLKINETNVKNETKCKEVEKDLQESNIAKNRLEEENLKLASEVKKLAAREEELKEDLSTMTARFHDKRTPTPEPEVVELKVENMELRKKIFSLEQVENEVLELRQENEQLAESRQVINAKLLEAEKIYYEEVEKLREMVIQRDDLIESMKADVVNVETDLLETRHLLESSSADKERITSEQLRKLEDLEDALDSFETVKRDLAEKELALGDSDSRVRQLSEENESLSYQIQKTLGKVETLENENCRLKNAIEDNLVADEEYKEFQAQRISRLESFIAEYEKEIDDLSNAKTRLENQIISLEDSNGKLQSECMLNDSLREQIGQLQKDLKNDTSLRQELGKSIEAAKSNLGHEISSLEAALCSEKSQHAQVRESMNNLEHENLDLHQEINRLQVKLDESVQEIQRLTSEKNQLELPVARQQQEQRQTNNNNEDMSSTTHKDMRIKELEHVLDENKRSICSLEDHISTLKFHLQQKGNELDDARNVLKVSNEKFETNMERMRDLQESLRAELAGHLQNVESLTEERNSYKNQVQEMNFALKNSLNHIKDLRSKASNPSSPTSLDDSAWTDLLARTSTSPGRNLSNLQNCLASLKAEMAILQSKLAPRPDSRNSFSGASPEHKNVQSSLTTAATVAASIPEGAVEPKEPLKEEERAEEETKN